jgi:hypothetical protein
MAVYVEGSVLARGQNAAPQIQGGKFSFLFDLSFAASLQS